jgi:hypothetical protein
MIVSIIAAVPASSAVVMSMSVIVAILAVVPAGAFAIVAPRPCTVIGRLACLSSEGEGGPQSGSSIRGKECLNGLYPLDRAQPHTHRGVATVIGCDNGRVYFSGWNIGLKLK